MRRPWPRNLPTICLARRAESQANANFALAQAGEIAECAVEADAGQSHCGCGEEREQGGAEAILDGSIVEVFLQRCECIHGAARVDFVDAAADRFGHRHGVALCADEIVGKRIGRAEAGVDGR